MRLSALLIRATWLIASAFSVYSLAVEPAKAAPASTLLFPPATGTSDLAPDPALVLGELPNGLRYALRANPEPRARASLRLVVAAGSFHETEAQRGLAHFLEHMAFNGSTHYAPGTLVEYFQRMGMNFGGDTNAYTSFDRTVYMLELPDTKPETLREGFRVLADFASGLLLKPEEIDRERGIILAEKLARDSADYRAAIAGYQFFLAGSLLPERLPIGIDPVIKSADRALFSDFYDTWYRPSRLAVIAVGDLDPATVVPQIRDVFAPLADRAPARPAPEIAAVIDPASPRFGYHHEPEASATTVSFQVVRPPDLAPDTAAKRRRDLPRDLAFAMLNRRLDELAKSEETPFVRAASSPDSFPGVFDGADLNLTARPGKWAETLTAGENELRRALRFGFRTAELREAIANFRNALDQAVKTDATRHSDDRAAALVDAFIEGTLPTTPAADLALLAPALEQITLEECHEALKATWSSSAGQLIGVIGNTPIGDGAPSSATAEIARVHAAAAARELTPPADRVDTPWAYTAFGPSGTVASRTEAADLGVTQVIFANGVRLNLKRTDFKAAAISVRARVGTGELTEPPSQPGLAFFAGAAFTAGGLGQHSADDLARILAGRNVGVGFQIADDALVFSGETTPADLALELQLLAAHLTDPGYRPEAQLLARRKLDPFYARLATQPSGPLNLEVQRLLASGDPRFGLPAKTDALARTLDELRTWLTPQLASGAIELSLVGDLDIDATIAAASATLGALPAREAKPSLEELRRVRIAPAGEHTLTFAGTIEKDLLAIYWPTVDTRDIGRSRRLGVLASILDDRLRKTIREELGGSYSPQAGHAPSDTYRDFGFIVAQITLSPGDLARVYPAVIATASDLAAQGVTEEELNRARLPILTQLRETERENAYWLATVLASSQEQPWRLDWARTRYSDYESVTKPELDALARTYLDPARAIRFTIKPASSSK